MQAGPSTIIISSRAGGSGVFAPVTPSTVYTFSVAGGVASARNNLTGKVDFFWYGRRYRNQQRFGRNIRNRGAILFSKRHI